MQQLQSVLGIFALLALAWVISESRRAVSLKQAAVGLAVTFAAALSCSKCRMCRPHLPRSTAQSMRLPRPPGPAPSFVFGYLGGGPLPFELKTPGAEFVLALQALPIVLVMSVLTTLLFYWRILPPIVRGFAWLLERTLGVGGAVGLSTAANIFLGMVEAPLFIRPYLASAHAQRTVHRDDRRHGRHRRHRAGDLCEDPRSAHPRCRRPSGHRFGAGRAGGDPDQPDHGARDERQAHRRRCSRSMGRSPRAPWMRSSRARRRGSNSCSTSSPC